MRAPIPVPYPIEELVPHAGPMCLLDRAVEGDEESLVAEAQIHDENLFCAASGVGGWVGIEYMAQAIAAWAGWRARLRGDQPRIGFILGTRRYTCARTTFRVGEVIRVIVHRTFQSDNGVGQFDCRIEIDGAEVAAAALNVLEPPDAAEVVKGMTDDR
jgi:predicted hotdog family 3-hydroxylacyl-ACP dehydratase